MDAIVALALIYATVPVLQAAVEHRIFIPHIFDNEKAF
jgi:hypothetical protein